MEILSAATAFFLYTLSAIGILFCLAILGLVAQFCWIVYKETR